MRGQLSRSQRTGHPPTTLNYDDNAAFGNSGLALGADGTFYATNSQFLIAIDGTTGTSRTMYNVPPSIQTVNYPPSGSGCSPTGTVTQNLSDYQAYPLNAPIVGPDGSVFAETYMRNSTYDYSCSSSILSLTSTSITETLSLLQVAPNGTVTVIPFKTNTTSANRWLDDTATLLGLGPIIPDGTGGILASWQDATNYAHITHITDVSSSGANDYTLPTSYFNFGVNQMVLGDQGSDIAYADDDNHILAFHVSNGSTAWMYTAPSTGLNLIAAVRAAGGVVATSTGSNENVLRFNGSGTLTTDIWSGSGLDYYVGNLWTGFPDSGGLAQAYYAGPVDVSTSVVSKPSMQNTNQSAQDYFVANFSQADPQQAVIKGVVNEILAAFTATSFPGYSAPGGNSSCKAWIESGSSYPGPGAAESAIASVLSGGGFAHGTIQKNKRVLADGHIENAITGLRTTNPDNSSTNVPSNPIIVTVVNDVGGFFQLSYNGQSIPVGATTDAKKNPPPSNPPYTGNTIQAQAEILLHEFGHFILIDPPLFLHDGTFPQNVIFNDAIVDKNCGAMIRALPGITGLSPTAGAVGSSVTISGINFGSSAESNIVTFAGSSGPISATITSWNTNGRSIVVTVPTGAIIGNVVVTISGVPATGPVFTVR